MHSIVWFWTVGRHDPTWVQAVATVALVVFTAITLAVLALYARDTHRLAKASVEQINLAKRQHSALAMRNYHIAYDTILRVQRGIVFAMQALVGHTFRATRQLPFYPNNWADVTSALVERSLSTAEPAVHLGVLLTELDFAVEEWFRVEHDVSRAAEEKVLTAIKNAGEQCKVLVTTLQGLGADWAPF